MRVLVVTDQGDLAQAIARHLREQGVAVDIAADAATGRTKARSAPYDVVVLDRDLADRSADELCRSIASRGRSRILMIAAQGSIDARVTGLSLGADDYLVKPFSRRELTARVRALYRRSAPAVPPLLRCGDLVLDPASRLVTRAGHQVKLTFKETAVLEVLLMARGAVVSGDALIGQVWDERTDAGTSVLRVTVMNLRHKLGPPPVIRTVVRGGYRLGPANA